MNGATTTTQRPVLRLPQLVIPAGDARPPLPMTPFETGAVPAPAARRASSMAPNRSGPVLVEDLKREVNLGRKLMDTAAQRFKGDPLRQVDFFFDNFSIPAATGRKREASIKTHAAYKARLRKCLQDLASVNMRVQNLTELSRKHAAALTRLWESEGASVSYMANLNTVMRRVGIWMGKPDMVPVLSALVANPEAARRSHSATEPKTLKAKGVDAEELFRDMDAECRVAGLQLRLMLAFGLRVEEVVMLRPFEADRGDELYVVHGTKGGRPRHVPCDTEEKRALIEMAKAIASGNAKRILTAHPRSKFHQARDRFYYLCKKIGLTKRGRGVTPHGLRHEFANERYVQLTGRDSPVNGGSGVAPTVDREAREVIVRELGHSDRYKTAAYLGTAVHMAAWQRRNLDRVLASVRAHQPLQDAIVHAQLQGLWLLGPVATGEKPRGVVTAAWRTSDGVLAREHEQQLVLHLGRCLQCICVLVREDSPSAAGLPTLEIF